MRSALARRPHAARPGRRREDELPLELVLEQSLDDVAALLDLECERAFREPRGRGRAEQVRAFQRAVRFGERRQMRLRHALEQHHGVADVLRRDAAATGCLPLDEELLEHLVKKLPALLRRQPGLLVAFLRQPEDVRREVLERTLEVSLHVADGVDPRARASLPRRETCPRPRSIATRGAQATRAARPSGRKGRPGRPPALHGRRDGPPGASSCARSVNPLPRAPRETATPARSRRPRA